MTFRNALLAATIVLSTTACTLAAADAPRERVVRFSPNELINTGGWILETAKVGGSAIAEVSTPGIMFEMTFANGEVSASGGCNQLRGAYKATGKRLDMTLAIATRMSCTDDKNIADRSFSERMSRSFKVELIEPQPYRMRLTSDSGEVMVFQAKPVPL